MLSWLYEVPYGFGLVLRKGLRTGVGLGAAELRPGPVILEQAVGVVPPMEAKVPVQVDAVTALEERRDGPRSRAAVFTPEPVRAVRELVPARAWRCFASSQRQYCRQGQDVCSQCRSDLYREISTFAYIHTHTHTHTHNYPSGLATGKMKKSKNSIMSRLDLFLVS